MYLSNICYLNGHIVTYYVLFVNNTLLCDFSNHSRVCILITDVSRGGNVYAPNDFFLHIYLWAVWAFDWFSTLYTWLKKTKLLSATKLFRRLVISRGLKLITTHQNRLGVFYICQIFIVQGTHAVTFYTWLVISTLMAGSELYTSLMCGLVFLLFNSPAVFVKYLLGVQLLVDILYVFAIRTSRAII